MTMQRIEIKIYIDSILLPKLEPSGTETFRTVYYNLADHVYETTLPLYHVCKHHLKQRNTK